MSGYHGTVGATGVRPAVCPGPLRRALTLAGLLTGILFTVWLVSAAPAHAAEPAGIESALSGGLTESTENLGGSIGGAVATVGERATNHATRAVDGASEAAQAVEAETAAPVQQVRDAVRETSLPRSEYLPELVVPAPAQVTEPAAEVDDDTSAEAGQARETQAETPGEVEEADERPATEALVAARAQTASAVEETGASGRGTAGDTGPRGAEPVTTIAGGTGPAASGSASAPAVAGFLPVTGAPAPAPGLFEAARHVLRSAPADPADEPTFSPD